jgi:hypothetical protein
MSENQGNHPHSGKKMVGYSIKMTLLSTTPFKFTSPLNLAAAYSALP